MRISLTAVAALTVVATSTPGAASGQEPNAAEFARRLDSLLQPWASPDVPGVAVLVQRHGETIYKNTFGMAVLEHDVPITSSTRFDLASVSKHITSFAVLMLEAEGVLHRDDDIREYLPELPEFGTRITIRHLLHQTSGLWEFWTILTQYGGYRSRDYFTMDDVLQLLSHQNTLTFAPGERYAYTNTNYSLLAEIVARATGESFGAWAREHVFEPLGMTDTQVQEDCTLPIPGQATAYEGRPGAWVLSRPSNVEIPGSAHTFTTLDDMERWLRNFFTNALGGAELFEEWTTPGTLRDGRSIPYAAGLEVLSRRGTTVIGHSGQTGGYRTHLLYMPEHELGVVILANARSTNTGALAFRILYTALGWVERPDPPGAAAPTIIALDSAALEPFVGGYRLDGSERLMGVYRAGTGLVGSIWGLGSEYFRPLADTVFLDRSGNARLTFRTDGSGDVVGAVLDAGEMTLTARRIRFDAEATVISPDVPGSYYSEALGIACQLQLSGHHLVLSRRRYAEDFQLHPLEPDHLLSEWGFISIQRDGDGHVTGFRLTDEVFGFQDVWFARIPG